MPWWAVLAPGIYMLFHFYPNIFNILLTGFLHLIETDPLFLIFITGPIMYVLIQLNTRRGPRNVTWNHLICYVLIFVLWKPQVLYQFNLALQTKIVLFVSMVGLVVYDSEPVTRFYINTKRAINLNYSLLQFSKKDVPFLVSYRQRFEAEKTKKEVFKKRGWSDDKATPVAYKTENMIIVNKEYDHLVDDITKKFDLKIGAYPVEIITQAIKKKIKNEQQLMALLI